MLRSLAYVGPRAINEVLLDPMGMTGARWLEDTLEGGPRAAQREIDETVDRLAHHPPQAEVDAASKAMPDILRSVTQLIESLNKESMARAQAMRGRLAAREEPFENGDKIVDIHQRQERSA
jgi:hypothetical protein